MSTTFWESRLDEMIGAIDEIQSAAEILDLVVQSIRRTPTDEPELTLHLSDLLARTVDDPWWDDTVYFATHYCAGARVNGPLCLDAGQAWACAAAAVVDLVGRAEEAVWQYNPFGEALAGFNAEYDRLVRAVAIRSGRLTEDQAGDDVPAERRVRPYPIQPPRSAVLRAGWDGGIRSLPDVEVTAAVWAAIDELRGVWDRGRRAIATVIAFQRNHLATVPLTRVRAELEWEYARAVTQWEAHGVVSGDVDARDRAARQQLQRNDRQEARDCWIYEQVTGTELTYDNIRRRLSKIARENGWRVIGSVEGIRQCAIRYAEVNGLPPPPARQQR